MSDYSKEFEEAVLNKLAEIKKSTSKLVSLSDERVSKRKLDDKIHKYFIIAVIVSQGLIALWSFGVI